MDDKVILCEKDNVKSQNSKSIKLFCLIVTLICISSLTVFLTTEFFGFGVIKSSPHVVPPSHYSERCPHVILEKIYPESVPELVPVQNVPGTLLLTGTFYKLGMRRFPGGTVTWTEKSTGTGNYVQVDYQTEREELYAPGGKWYKDAQWMIVPTEDQNAFQLINRGVPHGIFTWTYEKSPRGHFVQLSTKVEDRIFYRPGQKWRDDSLIQIKPTKVPNHYTLKIKNLPQGVITWGKQYGENNNRFVEVDLSRNITENYEPRQIWGNDVLFTFTPLTKIRLTGTITEFKYNLTKNRTAFSDYENLLHPMYEIESIQNDSKTLQIVHLTYNKSVASNYKFQFAQNIAFLSNISCKANLPYQSDTYIVKGWQELKNPNRSRNLIEISWTEESSKQVFQKSGQTFTIDTEVNYPPYVTKLYSTWYGTWAKDLELNFSAKLAVNGFIDRLTKDGEIYSETVPINDLVKYLASENIESKVLDVAGNQVLLNVDGIFTGSYIVENTFRTLTYSQNEFVQALTLWKIRLGN